MNIFKKNALLMMSLLLYTGCSSTTSPHPNKTKYLHQNSNFIVLKTPVLRYADQGFVNSGGGMVNVEIYSNGVAVMKFKIENKKVCLGTGIFSCMDSKQFNMRYLNINYPDDIMYDIFTGKAIFSGKNKVKSKTGFAQEINKSGVYKIRYSVLNHTIIFHDTISNILIKIREK